MNVRTASPSLASCSDSPCMAAQSVFETTYQFVSGMCREAASTATPSSSSSPAPARLSPALIQAASPLPARRPTGSSSARQVASGCSSSAVADPSPAKTSTVSIVSSPTVPRLTRAVSSTSRMLRTTTIAMAAGPTTCVPTACATATSGRWPAPPPT